MDRKDVWDFGDLLQNVFQKKSGEKPRRERSKKQRDLGERGLTPSECLDLMFIMIVVAGVIGVCFLLYIAGATPFLYPHEFVHGDVPTGSSIQFLVLDDQNTPLPHVPIVLETYEGEKRLSSDETGYVYFGMIYWRQKMPVTLGEGFESCTSRLGPVYIGSTSTSTVKLYVSCP